MSKRNYIRVIGNIIKTPELKTSKNGKNYCIIMVSVETGKDTTEAYNALVFDKPAETYCKFLKTGNLVMIEGTPKATAFEKDGKTETRINILEPQILLLSRDEVTKTENSMRDGIAVSEPNLENKTNYEAKQPEKKLNEWESPEGLPF